MKRQAVVDAPDATLAIDETVTALPVGVVHDDVEGSHGAKVPGATRHQRKIMLAQVGDDELLERSWPKWSVAPVDGEGHDLPAERVADQVGSNLALPQGAVGKVVERCFARARLVDGEGLRAIRAADLRQVGVVGAIRRQAAPLDPPFAQQLALRLAALAWGRSCHRPQ